MSRFSDWIKIIYLTLVILFAMGVFFYLLDMWGLIRLENYMPAIIKSAPVVPADQDSPTELELERLRKEEERLKDEELRLKELSLTVEGEKTSLQKKVEEIDEARRGIEDEKKRLEEELVSQKERNKMIREMAGRIYSMPPNDAVAIVAGWSNTDLVDVFLQMEKDAEAEGRQSIVPYLLTKMPRDRAALITTMMMDQESRILPLASPSK